jgi:uncharacterized membrane protein YfcA
MKLPQRSLAYCWAKLQLRKESSKYSPAICVGSAIAMFVVAFLHKESPRDYISFGVFLLFAAYLAWERIGMQEVFAEQQQLLANAHSKEKT